MPLDARDDFRQHVEPVEAGEVDWCVVVNGKKAECVRLALDGLILKTDAYLTYVNKSAEPVCVQANGFLAGTDESLWSSHYAMVGPSEAYRVQVAAGRQIVTLTEEGPVFAGRGWVSER